MKWSAAILVSIFSSCTGMTFAQDTSSTSDSEKAVLHVLSEKGILSPTEFEAVLSATELNSQLMPAAIARAKIEFDPVREIKTSSPEQLTAIKNDLLNRASLQAIASGAVPVDMALREKLSSYLEKIGSEDLLPASLPLQLYEEALWVLNNQKFILHPLCRDGRSFASAAVRKDCIPNDPWSADLFRSVVSISVAGKPVCTGTILDDGIILTAAHCVIRQAGSEREVMTLADVSVFDSQSRPLLLQEAPRVPMQMMPDCLPICPDYAYDFAVLKLRPTTDSKVAPIPILTSLAEAGDFPITIAGYGVSKMKRSTSSPSLQVGAQRLKIKRVEDPLEWTYSASFRNISSFCVGDSGGPVFHGSPRKLGDNLTLVGVISRFLSADGTCFEASAKAVNLTQAGPRAALCGLLNHSPPFCL